MVLPKDKRAVETMISRKMYNAISDIDSCLYRYSESCDNVEMDFAAYAKRHLSAFQKELGINKLSSAELAYLLRKASREIYMRAKFERQRRISAAMPATIKGVAKTEVNQSHVMTDQ